MLILEGEQVEQLARKLADLTGESVTQAVAIALEDQLKKLQAQRLRPSAHRPRLEVVEAISRHFQSLPDLDTREPDEILGY